LIDDEKLKRRPMNNDESPSSLPLITFLLLLACMTALFVFYKRLQQLSDTVMQTEADISHLVSEFSNLLDTLENKKGKNQLVAPADLSANSYADYQREQEARVKIIQGLNSGMYQLSTTIALMESVIEPPIERDFTIYHIQMTLPANGTSYPIQVGIATSGYLSVPRLYIDYNSDGRVDVGALHQLVGWLPLQKIFSRSVNPATAQQLYNIFLQQHEEAAFSNIDTINNSGNTLVQEIWNIISSHTDDILGWIEADGREQISQPALEEGARF